MRATAVRLILAGTLCAGSLLAQTSVPLGDVARSKQAPPKKAKVVITDDDLPARPSGPSDATSRSTSNGAVAIAEDSHPQDESGATPGQSPQLGSDIQEMQARVDKLKAYEESLTKHLQKMSDQLKDETSDFRRQMWTEALQRQSKTLADMQRERSGLEQKIDAANRAAEQEKRRADEKAAKKSGAQKDATAE